MSRKVLVAMSGGVDSSVSAYLLLREGYEVMGITMLALAGGFSEEAVDSAGAVARRLGIDFRTMDVTDEFERDVVAYFCSEYGKGRTPNPCIVCNEKIKFGILQEKALDLGAEYMATGHYARVGCDRAGKRRVLRRGIDRRKDQSYMLFSLSQKQLERALFPLGEYSKSWVREIAREANLKAHDREESQEICFIQGSGYADFVTGRIARKCEPGPIVDTGGNVLGEHNGIHLYTVGQRKGLGINKGRVSYVVRIDAGTNTVVVGGEHALYKKELRAYPVNWISILSLERPLRCSAKIRYKHDEAPCTISPLEGGAVGVEFDEPQRAITPGQAVVFYDGDTVIGGGWIR